MAGLRRRGLLAAGLALPAAGHAQALRDSLVAPDALVSPTTFFNPGNAQIAEAFAAVAFGGDAGTGAPPRERLLRFRLPMRIALLGEDAATYAPWVALHARHLAQLTGGSVELAGSGPSNVVLLLSRDAGRFLRESGQRTALARLFGSEAALDAFLGGLPPDGGGVLVPTFRPGAPHDIAGGVVLVPTGGDPAVVWAAIVEELSQLLGLLGDEARIGWSAFNDHSPYCDLTEQDRWLVRLLYDRAITPGMRRRDAQRAALEAMRRLRPDELRAGPGHPELDETDAQVAEAFVTLAFAGQGAAPGTPRTRLARWDAPVRVRFLSDAAHAPYRRWLGAQVGHLAWLTRHLVEMPADGPANLVVLVAADPGATLARPEIRAAAEAGFPPLDEALRALPTQSAPSFRFTLFADAARTQPQAALVVVRGGAPPPRIWTGLVEQTAAVLGMFGRDDTLEGTIFGDRLPHLDLMPLDQRLLRLLYLSALRPGLTREEARTAARQAAPLSRIAP